MEHLWTPWRFSYVAGLDRPRSCVFCALLAEDRDIENLILLRARKNFVLMNLYPYSSGHLMVLPYEHTADFSTLDSETTTEMMELTQRAQKALSAEYRPNGFNLGMNLGKCAGAGVEEHLHLHVVPRWIGDANFMSVVGETRIVPDDLNSSFEKLKKHF